MNDIPWPREQMRDEMEFRGKVADYRRREVETLTAQLATVTAERDEFQAKYEDLLSDDKSALARGFIEQRHELSELRARVERAKVLINKSLDFPGMCQECGLDVPLLAILTKGD